jgi:TatD DNase family protein
VNNLLPPNFIDTHCHLDGKEFDQDREEVMARAAEAGCTDIFIPAIDLPSSRRILDLCQRQSSIFNLQSSISLPRLYPMVGLHPEEVRPDWREQLEEIKKLLYPCPSVDNPCSSVSVPYQFRGNNPIAIGEVGLDYYWSREYEQEQLLAFEEQVRWSVETRLPLMIHCRKAQNEMVQLLKRYKDDLPGGVFHCFTGNAIEAQELLQFPRFVLGVGGVLTFKKSHLPEVLAEAIPLDRIVLETDAPYMAPVPMRGQRNEPAYIVHVLERMAHAYGISTEEMARHTNENVKRVFHE